MSKKLLALLVGCAVALCLGLVGCGGGAQGGGEAQGSGEAAAPAAPEPAPEATLEGVWDIQNGDEFMGAILGASGGEDLDESVKQAISQVIPEIVFLNINADGTFQLVAASEAIEGTWEKTSDAEVTLTSEGSPVVAKYDPAASTLTLEEGGVSMIFAKTGDEARAIPTEEELQSKVMEVVMAAMSASGVDESTMATEALEDTQAADAAA